MMDEYGIILTSNVFMVPTGMSGLWEATNANTRRQTAQPKHEVLVWDDLNIFLVPALSHDSLFWFLTKCHRVSEHSPHQWELEYRLCCLVQLPALPSSGWRVCGLWGTALEVNVESTETATFSSLFPYGIMKTSGLESIHHPSQSIKQKSS